MSSIPTLNLRKWRHATAGFALFAFVAPALAELDAPTRAAIELFGPNFIIETLPAPVIEDPLAWIKRRPGDYVYRFVTGSDTEEVTQVEQQVPDSANPETAWQRRIGDSLVQHLITTPERDILIVEEVDHQHGFRVVIEPGVPLPRRIEPGDTWEIDSKLTVFHTEDGSHAYDGRLTALHHYIGAFRIRTPAGVFDTVAVREDFIAEIGPLEGEDDRLLFFAKGVGLVAEEEGLRASALLIFRMSIENAKVLVSYPDAP